MQIISTIIQIIHTAIIIWAAWTAWISFNNPEKYLSIIGENLPSKKHPAEKRRYIGIIAMILGYSLFVFGGVNNSLSWIPTGIGFTGDDGEFTSFRFHLSGLLGLWGGILMMYFFRRHSINTLRLQAGDESKVP